MYRKILLSALGMAFVLLQALTCIAQSGQQAQAELPSAVAQVGTVSRGHPSSVSFHSADAMSSRNRRAVSERWSFITEESALNGYDLDRKKWSYQQIACPVLSGQILLLFSRRGGAGDRSAFSALVPIKPDEPVQVVPLLRRGYTPFSAAPENPMMISAFNEALASERLPRKRDWLTASLCYAALSGAHVVASTPTIEIKTDGGAVVRFLDAETPQHPKAWKLIFDKKGNLVKTAVERAQISTIKPAP